MKLIRQIFRQPLKFLFGVLVVALAVSILCVSLGQSIAANKTEAAMEYNFTTVALLTTKYNYTEMMLTDLKGNLVPYRRWDQTLHADIQDWIRNTVETRTDLVKTVSNPGLASAYISELAPDNITHHPYQNPMRGTKESIKHHRMEAKPSYSTAMLEIVLDKVEEPWNSVSDGITEDGTEVSVELSAEVELVGTVKSVVCLDEGYDDPTGRRIYLTLTLPDMESLEALDLEPGKRYLVYGSNYLDGDWALRGDISYHVSSKLGTNVNLEALDPDGFYYYGEETIRSNAAQNPYDYAIGTYTHNGCTIMVDKSEIKNLNAVSITAEDKSAFGNSELIEHANGSYFRITWDRWITGENGSPVQITQEEYRRRYEIPTIAELEGSVSDFLQSEDGQLWAKQIEYMKVNNQAFPVIGVDKLGYVTNFAQETARVVAGRDFTQEELDSGAKVCILAETLAAANGLSVGDTISPRFYNYDWDSPHQEFISESYGVVNPSAYTYTANTEFAGEAQEYRIIGLYRQDNAWGDVCENLYSFTPNTVFVPKSSVSSDMDYGNQAFFQTLILKNGTVEEFRSIVDEAGYEGLFVYYDQGYTEISQSVHDYKTVAQRALLVGSIVYGAILVLFLFLFPGSQRKTLSTMNALGAPRKYKIAQIFMSGIGILIPGTAIGVAMGARLWQRVTAALTESAGIAITLEMDITALIIIALGQLALASLLTAALSIPMTRDTGIAKRM